MHARGIDKPGRVSQLERLFTSKRVHVYVYLMTDTSSRIPGIIAICLQRVFPLFLKSIDFGGPELSPPYCHIDQCHCFLFPHLNIPWTHHSLNLDLHPHLILEAFTLLLQYFFEFPVFPSYHPLALSPFSLLQCLICFFALISSVKEESVYDEGSGTICFQNN